MKSTSIFKVLALTLHLTALTLVIFTVILMCTGRIAMAQDKRQETISQIASQLAIEFNSNCDNEDCQAWVAILDELSAKPHHDMHPNGQTVGGQAGSTHNSKLTPLERANELLPKLKNKSVRKAIERLLSKIEG